ncbi:MAG: hypothetical protein WKG00_26970 [Polyangiaceae bacterium]
MVIPRTPILAVAALVASMTAAPAGSALAQQPAQAPPQPQPSGYDPGMQAGGLAPPPPMGAPPPAAQPPPAAPSTEQRLDQARSKDSGRGVDFLYADIEGGFEHVGLKTFSSDEESLTAGFAGTTGSGPVVGASVALQLLFVTIGPRVRIGFFPDWQLFSAGGEVGIHIPVGSLEPHLALGAGYTALGSFETVQAIDVRGFYARAGGGLDYYVTPVLSLGAAASWELLGLTRPELGPDDIARIRNEQGLDQTRAELLSAEGTSYGSALAITAVVGLHL